MSYERLEDAINALFLAEKTLKDNKSLFEQYITDPSISLDKRWDFWTLAPDSLKKTNGWISSENSCSPSKRKCCRRIFTASSTIGD